MPQIAFGPALFYAGLYTLGIALVYEIPIPVQPMKTIASVGLLGNYPQSQILAAGILMAMIVFLLQITKMISWFQSITPVALVRGIQLGLGLSLMQKGIDMAYVHGVNFDIGNVASVTQTVIWLGIDSVLTSVLFAMLCMYFFYARTIPMALLLFLYGISVSIYRYNTILQGETTLQFGPNWEPPVFPSFSDFQVAFTDMVLPQLPLTLLNR